MTVAMELASRRERRWRCDNDCKMLLDMPAIKALGPLRMMRFSIHTTFETPQGSFWATHRTQLDDWSADGDAHGRNGVQRKCFSSHQRQHGQEYNQAEAINRHGASEEPPTAYFDCKTNAGFDLQEAKSHGRVLTCSQRATRTEQRLTNWKWCTK
ncbi:hypothetical protein MKX08_000302 [Trichoderma sp. CBMAI-0020]|nr:hypothetical protein MKX08_000302 [Trichoderma sp. CBMAI-0020]